MSILLDAVTKEKQQQMGELPDAVLTPRANYQHVTSHSAWLKYLLLVVVILLGIVSAWGVAKFITPTPKVSKVSESQKVAVNGVSVARTNQAAFTETSSAENEVRIANKVALPIAKPLSQVSVTTQFVATKNQQQTNDNEVMYDYRVNNNRGEVTLNSSSKQGSSQQVESQPKQSQLTNSQQQTHSSQQANTVSKNQSSSRERQLTAAELQALYGDDAIILGANSNYKKTSDLDALRMKVSAAASDVNYEQQSQQRPSTNSKSTSANNTVSSSDDSTADNSNNLMAAFEAALKEVEYENSANTPVTEEKLDPIPTPKKDEIPSYGQLPASVQLQVPEFNIQAHVYSSAAENRWLNVDGKELQEGDSIKGKLKVIEIRPRDVVLEIEGEKFKVPAI